jgi:hypothetical protein
MVSSFAALNNGLQYNENCTEPHSLTTIADNSRSFTGGHLLRSMACRRGDSQENGRQRCHRPLSEERYLLKNL